MSAADFGRIVIKESGLHNEPVIPVIPIVLGIIVIGIIGTLVYLWWKNRATVKQTQ